MLQSSPSAWKVVLAVALLGAILASARARAPRQAAGRHDMRWLIASAITLYAAGAAAWLTHHIELAVGVYAVGIGIAALAAWYSRGDDSGEPPAGADPVDEQPPPDPDGLGFDWNRFERDFRDYAERPRAPAGSPR